jgi:hypothetical protein
MVAKAKKALPSSRPDFLGGLQTKTNWGYLHEFSRKKFEKAKKVTKLPALTVSSIFCVLQFLIVDIGKI